jgi:hypothetical protein
VALLVEELHRYDPALAPALRRTAVASHAPMTAIQPLLDWSRRAIERFR